MEKLRLGRTDLMVTKLGFGGIPFRRVSVDEAVTVVRRCTELGINFIDTANVYTTSEERIGKAIAGRREGLILATKSMARDQDGIADHIQLSLRRLGVESIDLYQFHNVSDFDTLDKVLDPNGPSVVVEEARRAGKVKHIGITSHQIDVAKKAVESDQFETIMFPFNFITCEASDELLPLAREHDVGFIAMKPLAGGMIDNATIAFKYLFQFPDVVSVVGIEKVYEIEEIVQVLEGPRVITTAEQAEMQQFREELGTQFCRRCDYCQPCPAEIPISFVMDLTSTAKRVPPDVLFSANFIDAAEKTANCTECGDCEERCPYQLPIREMIAEQVKLYHTERRKYQEKLVSSKE